VDQHKYPQAIQEYATAAQLLDDKNMADFAAALDVRVADKKPKVKAS
jgi:hypothetical protein